jgi:hypothetical protein
MARRVKSDGVLPCDIVPLQLSLSFLTILGVTVIGTIPPWHSIIGIVLIDHDRRLWLRQSDNKGLTRWGT